MDLKDKYEEYTESEFFELLRNICEVNTDDEELHSIWVRNFVKVSEHPRGTDLIYYPEEGEDDSPEGILKTVKEWRTANGKPGFKHG
ncbi:bacteriocin immunity protein [Salmonella enterica]|nr:bacteriocin immunity protein [Salmonella enterica]EMD7797574.1 bacteriocin immunity protein [Salmonella enterica]